jgi:hypothetical protein
MKMEMKKNAEVISVVPDHPYIIYDGEILH